MPLNKRLIICHFWLGFAGFLGALVLGEWQMFIRSPLHAWLGDPEWYYRAVTGHGTAMAYVLPTLIAMAVGYFMTETSLNRPITGVRWAWVGFFLAVAGPVVAVVPVALGKASVLYTFYPPLIGNAFYSIGTSPIRPSRPRPCRWSCRSSAASSFSSPASCSWRC